MSRLPFSKLLRHPAAPFLLLVVVAVGIRLWGLEIRPYHYDESIHAYYSWRLYSGQGYQHDPMMHGPFQFHVIASAFWLLGDSDFTARLPAAAMGGLLVGLPYFLRPELGRNGALAASLLLTFSPGFLYFSRFARNDIFVAFWSLLLLCFLLSYLRTRRPLHLYISSVVLSLAFATKEVIYMLLLVGLSFLFVVSFKELGRAARARFNFSHLPAGSSLFLLLFSLSLPLYSPGLSLFQDLVGVTLANKDRALGLEGEPLGTGRAVAVGLFLLTMAFSWFLGMRWRPRIWVGCFALFWGTYIVLYTTFGTNYKGIGTGIWGSVTYWMVQQGKHRLDQPLIYYPSLLSTYEFLPLLLSIAGGLYYLWRGGGSPFTRWLLFWSAGSLGLFSYAGEKAPWLLLHLSLPLTLLGAKFAGDWLSHAALPQRLALGMLVVVFAFWVRASLQASYQRGDKPVEALVYAQASYELVPLRPQIEEELRQGRAVYAHGDLSWPWQWYFRGYPRFYTGLPSSPTNAVLIVTPGDQTRGTSWGPEPTYRHLLWFPEDYRNWKPRDWLKRWPRYFLFRESAPYWFSKGVLVLREGEPLGLRFFRPPQQ